ncbi:MAG TPA: DUF2027 domain-containing protein [Bacteroidales bacterium]|nr:MAG: recombination and DNA strand exchange inhibitor protein [Bacteroidetes bacterium ADurb.Bin217]HPH15649.1 DUF2027 domain-containing protein [Bacteroidales bacterium]HPM13490.1 DUF2027 domain-containing protein [Bacteroidales bacterium]
MELHVGDTVRYLNDVGGGKVSKILSNTMVEIIDESGFQIPVLVRELVCIQKNENSEQASDASQITQTVVTETEDIEGNDTPNFYIGFVRNTTDSKLFDVYVINDCNYYANLVVFVQKNTQCEYLQHILIEPNTKVFVQQLSYEEISDITHILVQTVLFKTKAFQALPPLSIEFVIHPVKFYKPGVFTVNDFFDEDAYVVEMPKTKISAFEQDAEMPNLEAILHEKISQDMYTHVPEVKEKEHIREIDLHIHELVDNELGLDAAAKLDIQLQTFEKELARAMSEGVEKVVFIHGVGNGVLKAKIRGILDRDYGHLLYQDASFQKYKFGATLIYIKGATRKKR